MSIEGILVGIIALLVGLGLCFAGLKYFLLLLPVWGAIVGFLAGSNLWYAISPTDGFLATTIAIVVGIVFAVVFAALSYLYYYVAVIIAGGAIGYLLGIGFMGIFGLTGIVAWIVGLIVGVVFAGFFLRTGMPIWLAIWGTAIGGASAIVTGLAVLIGHVKVQDMNYGFLKALWEAPDVGFIWIGVGIVLAVVGAFAQMKMVGEAMEAAITREKYANPGM